MNFKSHIKMQDMLRTQNRMQRRVKEAHERGKCQCGVCLLQRSAGFQSLGQVIEAALAQSVTVTVEKEDKGTLQ